MGLCDSDVENMRERVEEKWEGKVQKDWTFLGRPLGLEAIDDLSLSTFLFLFCGKTNDTDTTILRRPEARAMRLWFFFFLGWVHI